MLDEHTFSSKSIQSVLNMHYVHFYVLQNLCILHHNQGCSIEDYRIIILLSIYYFV